MQNVSKNSGATLPPIPPDFDAIEAVGLHLMGEHWCAWRFVPKSKGKPSKVPYSAKGKAISSQHPEQWISYEVAKSLFLRGGFQGVGYLPQPEDGIVGLDADGVTNVDGTVVGSGRDIVAQLEDVLCYLERSPSGTGLRGFIRATKAGKAKVTLDGHSVEAYQPGPDEKAQYVTVTGCIWGEARTLEPKEAQARLEDFLLWAGLMRDEVDAVGGAGGVGSDIGDGFDGWVRRDDAEVIRVLLSEANLNGAMNKVWDGDTSEAGGESEGRGKLIKQLWYITRDPEQIARVVRRSGLDPRKYDETRSGINFLAWEIARIKPRQKRNLDADRAERKALAERKKASTLALQRQAQEVTGEAGINDLLRDNGRLGDDLHTASELLSRDGRLVGVVWFDEFAGHVRKAVSLASAFGDKSAPKEPGAMFDDDVLAVEAWLRSQWKVSFPNATVKGAVRRWARATSINPVTDKLQKFADSWDGASRLDTWMADYLGVDVSDPEIAYYCAEVGKRFMIGVVARAFDPGCQQHQMTVLEGAQGAGKSAAVRVLALAVNEGAYLESFTLQDGKDCLLQLRGKLLGEWAELVGFGRREAEAVKDFLSRGSDEYRDPYGTYVQKWPRTVSFFATTNEREYLRDATGNRRYWPVLVGVIDLEQLRLDAPQLWGEAVKLYQGGARWWVDPQSPADARFRVVCDKEQRGRMVATAMDDRALDLADQWVTGKLIVDGEPVIGSLSVPEMRQVMFPGAERVSESDWMLATTAMKRVGWANDKSVNGRKRWAVTEAKAAELRKLHHLTETSPKKRRGLKGKK